MESATELLELERRIAVLEAAVAARDKFIAAVGHELRNSAAPLVMLADQFSLASETVVSGRRLELLTRSLTRLTAALDRVADIADLRGEKLVLLIEDVDLTAVVHAVSEELAAAANGSGISLRIEATASAIGRWDHSRITQIVRHLIENAIRHSGSSTLDVTVTSDASCAFLSVADRGRGIEQNRRADLFAGFDAANPKRAGGLGVGLWVVHTLCARFKGNVSLDQEHSPGACFRVALPRAA